MVGFNFDNGGRLCIPSILHKYQQGMGAIFRRLHITKMLFHSKKVKVKGISSSQRRKTFRFRTIHWNKVNFTINKNKGRPAQIQSLKLNFKPTQR